MAQLIIPAIIKGVVAGIIGAAIGYGLAMLMAPDAPDVEGPRIHDVNLQNASFGTAINRCWGTIRTQGTVIWNSGLKETARYRTIDGGHGGDDATVTTYEYSASWAVGICKGPISGIRRIWMDNSIVFDNSYRPIPNFNYLGTSHIINVSRGAGGFSAGQYTVYLGTEDQLPDPVIESYLGVDNTPCFRGLAYIVFNDIPLGTYGNRIPNVEVEIVKDGTATNVVLEAEVIEGDDLTGICFTTGGDLITCDNATISRHNGISDEIIYQIPCPLQGWTIQEMNVTIDPNGNLLSWVAGAGLNQRLYFHHGITSSVEGFREFSSGDVDTVGDMDFTRDGRLLLFGGNTIKVVAYPPGGFQYLGGFEIVRKIPHPAGVLFVEGGCVDDSGDLWITGSDAGTSKIWKCAGLSGNWVEQFNTRYQVASALTVWSGNLVEAAVVEGVTGYVVFHDGFDEQLIIVDTFDEETQPLSQIITDLCADSGIAASDIDVTALTAIAVNGFSMPANVALRSALDHLAQAYRFDLIDIDYKLIAKTRGAGSSKALTLDDLGAAEAGQQLQTAITRMVVQELDIPRQVSVHFRNKNMDYQPGAQRSIIITGESKFDVQVELNMVLTDDEAKQISDMLHRIVLTEKDKFKFTTNIKNIDLACGDVITVDGERMRVINQLIKPPALLEFETVADLQSSYASTVGAQRPTYQSPGMLYLGPSMAHFLDIPLLSDGHDDAGFYIGVHGFTPGWTGAVLFVSDDEGQSWRKLQVFSGGVVAGVATDLLGINLSTVWDYDSTVNIDLYSNQMILQSATRESVLAGANLAAIGAAGRWELIAFQTANLEGDGTWTLSNFIRGMRGTEFAIPTHQVGDSFVLLNAVEYLRYDIDTLNKRKFYKLVTSGRAIDQGDSRAFTNTGVGLEPLSPADPRGSRDGSQNLTITWKRRTRIGGDWNDNIDVPLGEAAESYEIDIYNVAFDTVLRTINNLSSETATYTAAQQTTDFGSPQASINMRIYQLSESVGRGYPKSTTL